LADTGTIFLDEIGEMPLATQVKLLRVLEGKEFIRVGGTRAQKVDVRVIAATNKDLERAVRAGEFREDLYYRLNAVDIRMAPLRERKEDIPLLAEQFITEFCKENQIEFEGFTDSAMRLLQEYSWPGNIRELKNLVESIIVLEKGNQVDEYTLTKHLKPAQPIDRNLPVPTRRSSEQVEREFIYHALLDLKTELSKLREDIFQFLYSNERPKSLPYYSEVLPRTSEFINENDLNDDFDLEGKTLEDLERIMVSKALEKFDGSKRKAAKSLGISERTLYRKIKEYDLPY